MSETMVERVARAIYEAGAKHEGTQTTWDELLARVGEDDRRFAKEAYECVMAEARAAIAEVGRCNMEAMQRALHELGAPALDPEVSPTPLDTPPSQESGQ